MIRLISLVGFVVIPSFMEILIFTFLTDMMNLTHNFHLNTKKIFKIFLKIRSKDFNNSFYLFQIEIITKYSIDQMLIDYVNRIKQLQEDRSKFQKQKDRNNFKEKINRQESKYQAYIIDQMNEKNKLVAASKIQGILTREVNRVNANAFQTVAVFKDDGCKDSFSEAMDKDESITVNFILVKLCTDTIKRVFAKTRIESIRTAFGQLHKYSKNRRTLEKSMNITKVFYLRQSFRKIVTLEPRQPTHLQTQNKFFDESFSMIYKNDRPKEKKEHPGMSESYLSFIQSAPNLDFGSQKQTAIIISRQRQEISKLHEDLQYLRSVLAQKTLQLKKKSLECDKLLEQLQKPHESLHQSSGYESRNSSYLSDMKRQLTGGKRIRKNNGSQLNESSPSLKGQQISRELLSKYMKESFKLKENMDLARDLCIVLSQKVRPEIKRQIMQVVKALSCGQDESVVDQM